MSIWHFKKKLSIRKKRYMQSEIFQLFSQAFYSLASVSHLHLLRAASEHWNFYHTYTLYIWLSCIPLYFSTKLVVCSFVVKLKP